MATVRMPISRAPRSTRTAMSPRLASLQVPPHLFVFEVELRDVSGFEHLEKTLELFQVNVHRAGSVLRLGQLPNATYASLAPQSRGTRGSGVASTLCVKEVEQRA